MSLLQVAKLVSHASHSLRTSSSGLSRAVHHFSQPSTTCLQLRGSLNEALHTGKVRLQVFQELLLMTEFSQALLGLEAGRARQVLPPLDESRLGRFEAQQGLRELCHE